MVGHSPSAVLQIAMGPAMTTLGKHRYLRHNNSEIGLVVALCYSQFMRITVPLVPYSGNTMREVFELIIDCMVGIGDIGSPTYARKVKVLELMSQVRSCVAMLDYDQHDLVLQLFRLFVESVSLGHDRCIQDYMRDIMISIVDNIDSISQPIMILLLAIRRREKLTSPAAHVLGKEEVDELTRELEVAMDSLESAQSALCESLSQVEELTVALRLAQSSPYTNTIEFSIAALGDKFTPTGCSGGHVEDKATSVTNFGAIDSGGMSVCVERSREPLVASRSPEVSTMTDDAGQIVDTSYVAVMDSPKSCVLVHYVTPSSS
ncbi:hypothetical protein SUGI_0478930 [Cryptomeria japonica]|nr:hypothetical protein SUGI_0478930 [Cryptomeria japonica]